MSLYTPVFPDVHESNTAHKLSPENAPATASGKQHSYIELLRDVHLFLSTKSDILCPPSRPNSPIFDLHVQRVKDGVQDIVSTTGGATSSGQWSRVSQTLKLGCVRGRFRPVTDADPCTPDEDTDWILADEESEWFEWEKKREENRRLRAKTNASQGTANAVFTAPDSLKPNHATVTGLSQPYDKVREWAPRDVSPTTLRAAREKVRKWQASVATEAWPDTASGSFSARATVGTIGDNSLAEKPQRSRTLDFAVVKSVAKPTVGKGGKGSLSRRAMPVRPIPPHGSSRVSTAPGDIEPTGICKTSSKRSSTTSHVKDVTLKIGDVPETPYLPPSFPAHLETSTPLPDPMKFIRTKPSPILPLPTSSLTPPLPTTADPPGDRQLVPAVPHAANVPSSLPPQIDNMQSGKRSRALSSSLDGIPDGICATSSAKRLRTLSPNCSDTVFKHSQSISPIEAGSDLVPGARNDARDTRLAAATPSHHHEEMSGVPMLLGEERSAEVRDPWEKLPTPTKSVKSVRSYFSTPDSERADSPMKGNLLLESPVSPMLTYAQNASGFLPQMTSTQVGKGSPSDGRGDGGVFGMGFSSQFDVERHVDRVSELLEKDVDFEGWLRDVRTVETDGDQ